MRTGFVLRHGHHIDIVDSDVKETGRSQGDDGRPDVAARNDLYPKNICYCAP
jgi:hypothetical protein